MSGLIKDGENWELIGQEEMLAGEHVQVLTAKLRTPSRRDGVSWTVVHRKAAVVVAPMTESGELVLIRQERVPVRQTLWECPAGQIDETAEHGAAIIRDTALRELREETGWELAPGGELVPLGHFFSSPGFTDEHAYLFLARPVVRGAGGAAHDENEAILDCRPFSAKEFRGMIAAGEIRDANTLAIYARLSAMGLLPER